MQIISYLEPQAVSSNSYGSLSVDEMLQKQKTHVFKHQRAQLSNTTSFSESTINLVDILEGLAKAMFKVRRIYLAFAIILAGWALFLSVKEAFYSRTTVVSLETEGADTGLLSNEMNTFISADPVDDFDSFGNLVLPELKETDFVKPIEYSSYTIKTGDTISSISKKFGLNNISTLISSNSIENVRKLYVGKTLKIPSIDGILYTVKTGDSLSYISTHYGVKLEAILDVNNLNESSLFVGEKLFIPGVTLDSNSLKKALGELFALPLMTSFRITSPFGYRADPFTGTRSFHTGIDMAAPFGTAIRAAMSGTVVAASYSSVFGNYVIVRHINGYQTLYAHMSATSVKVGQEVSQGQRLGALGSTGYSTGPHLHFTVYKNGKLIDPTTVLNLK